MFKPTGLLKVISVLMIVFGALGMVMVIFSYSMLSGVEEVPGVSEDLLNTAKSAITPLSMALSVLSGSCCILAGVFGVSGKSLKLAVIFGGLYSLNVAYNLVVNVISSGFSPIYIFNILIPLLFWWGLYQSKE